MALFNKLFTSRKHFSNNQEYASEKNIGFTKAQVRVVLFRECDFRGRKLLFDSTAIKRIQITSSLDNEESGYFIKNRETFAEISDGYGYMYIKPPTDSSHLAEMIFGLVAMSYRGSYFKIHNLENPSRLMFTQVFPSPKHIQKRNASALSHRRGRTSNQSLEHSIRLDDSGTSISDHFSVHSTASDTLLVCRHTMPLDVPQKLTESNSSMICDSGVYGVRSYSSCDGNKQFSSIPFWESLPSRGNSVSFSNSTLYKRWLRSSSLDQSVSSSTETMEDAFCNPHQRSSKLGLAFIIHLSTGQEESQTQFLMEHIALLESMLWRARQATEIAYLRPNNYLSVLVKMVDVTDIWLTNLLSGPVLSLNLWTSLYNDKQNSESSNSKNNISDCDNNNSINIYSAKDQKETSDILRSLFNNSNSGFSNHNSYEEMSKSSNLLSGIDSEKSEFSFSNITKIIKNEWDFLNAKMFGNSNRTNLAETFVQEFCELLDNIDIKDTNFFVSTLLTAVLTHHLGWVATCLPPDNESQILMDFNLPFNPLWGQLSDLYGAVGYPIKMSRTIILGNKKKDIVVRIINCLTYFIRCCDLERKHIIRSNIYEDNKTADYICHKNSCIPRANFKKYKDHLREMLNSNNLIDPIEKKCDDFSNMTQCFPEAVETNIKKGLCRTKKSNFDLDKLEKKEDNNTNSVSQISSWSKLKQLDCLNEMENESFFLENYSKIEQNDLLPNEKENVVFVLGDDEKLINIKNAGSTYKHLRDGEMKTIEKAVEKADSVRKISRPNFLDLIFKKYETFEEEFSKSHFKDKDFVKYETDCSIKPSTSWATLPQAEEEEEPIEKTNTKITCETNAGCCLDKPFIRSQSVPPESKEKIVKEEVKSKFRYSGIKFSLHQYPQVVTNYMRSKNLEMTNLSFSEITKKFDQISQTNIEGSTDFSQYEYSDEMEALQTPSNASELEFTNDLTMDMPRQQHARESNEKKTYFKYSIPDTTLTDNSVKISLGQFDNSKKENELSNDVPKMRMIYFPMPKSQIAPVKSDYVPYPVSLLRGLNDSYIPDLVLQGISAPKKDWESTLKNELSVTSQYCLLDQRLEESVAIIADTDTWEVQLVSSHTYVIDKGCAGVKVGMSQLIASMLDSLLKMWKLQVPPQLCLMHIEQRLQALCVRSQALAELLLATEFCSMEFLTSTLHLEVNDVPLLLAVASTYSPQVTQKYGISFQ